MGHHPPSLWRRLAAVWLLGLHLGGLGWTGPLLVLSAAAFDADHGVRLQAEGRGTRLVLMHDRTRGPASDIHRHGQVASMLVAFSQPTGPGETDHVLEFGPGSGAVPAAPADSPRTPTPRPSPDLARLAEDLPPAYRPPAHAGPVPDRIEDSGAVRLTRTVVLRI